MKKVLFLVLAIIVVTSMMLFVGVSCKVEPEEVIEEAAEEVEEAAEEVEEAAEEVEEAAEEETYQIAVIPTISEHPWWIRCKWGCFEAEKDFDNVEVIWNTFEAADAAKQLDTFNDMVSKGVDAIVLAAVDSEVMKQPVADAVDAGIPVFGFDVGVPGADIVWFVSGLEPNISGTTIGEGLAEEIGGEGKVGLMLAQQGAEVHVKRMEAAKAALAEYPDIEIVGEYADNDDQEKGLAIWESVLQAHPDLAGMGGCCTTNVAAACNAVYNAGLCGEVAIWGCGLPLQNAEFIKSGCAKGIFLMDPGEMSYIAVYTAVDYVMNGELPEEGDTYRLGENASVFVDENTTYVQDFVFTPENVDDFQF